MTSRLTLTKRIPTLWSLARSLAIFAGGFLVGLTLGFLVRRTFVFKNEVEVGDILNFFTAVVVAFILQNAIQKRVSNVRVEKDLLIARVNAIISALDETHKLFMQRAADVKSVNEGTMLVAVKGLSNQLLLLEQALQKSKARMSHIDLETLKPMRLEYRECAVGDDLSPRPYKSETVNLEDRIYRDMSLELISLTFIINHT